MIAGRLTLPGRRTEAEGGAPSLGEHLGALVWRLTRDVCGRVIGSHDPNYESYLERLRVCIEYHEAQFALTRPLELSLVIKRLERGEFARKTLKGNLPREVVLAQALQLGESRAAEIFDVEYMPTVRAIARHVGGERAVDAVDNFAAELVLPREGRAPRIATFLGRTTLAQWLGPVVANFWRTEARRKRPESLTVLAEFPAREDPAPSVDGLPCEGLLRPIFIGTCRALDLEDRLILQMLVLDEVSQKDLARSLGVNSGTITRRRQRATLLVFSRVRQLASECDNPSQADDCLQLMLAGEDPELRSRLATLFASEIRAGESP